MLYMGIYTYIYYRCVHVLYAYTSVCMCMWVCMYMHCLYIYTHTHMHIKSKGRLLSQMKYSRICHTKHAILSEGLF